MTGPCTGPWQGPRAPQALGGGGGGSAGLVRRSSSGRVLEGAVRAHFGGLGFLHTRHHVRKWGRPPDLASWLWPPALKPPSEFVRPVINFLFLLIDQRVGFTGLQLH